LAARFPLTGLVLRGVRANNLTFGVAGCLDALARFVCDFRDEPGVSLEGVARVVDLRDVGLEDETLSAREDGDLERPPACFGLVTEGELFLTRASFGVAVFAMARPFFPGLLTADSTFLVFAFTGVICRVLEKMPSLTCSPSVLRCRSSSYSDFSVILSNLFNYG
jgi:hypothetical protein